MMTPRPAGSPADASDAIMTWPDIWTAIGWHTAEYRAGLLAGAKIVFYGIAEVERMPRADRRQIARLRAIWWMASGGALLQDALPDAYDVSEVIRTKDHGRHYCLIDHPQALSALPETLRDARLAT